MNDPMPSPRRAFTLVEMLTTVALLIIVLGLMVSLARYVRSRSAEDLTRRILLNLHTAMLDYTRQYGAPSIKPFIEGSWTADEGSLGKSADLNNRQVVQFLSMRKELSAK